jgi:Type II secretion system (T2SS), protein M subtype b
MSERFSPLLHRLAALALLLIAVGAVILLIGLPLINYFNGLRAEIAQQRELLARFEAFAANKDAARSLAERSEAAMRSGIFLAGDTDALRAANLQAVITGIAQTQGARLSSARALPVEDRGGLHFIGVQAELETGIRQLQSMILALESHRPYLFVQSLQAAPIAGRRTDSEALKIRLGIVGVAATAGEAKP